MLSLHPWQRNLLQNIPPRRVLVKSASWRSKKGQQLGNCPHPTGSQPSGRQRASRHGYSTALAFWTGYCLSATTLPKQKSTHKNVFPSSTIENFVPLCMEMPFSSAEIICGWTVQVVNSPGVGTHAMPEVAQLYSPGLLKHELITWRMINPFLTLLHPCCCVLTACFIPEHLE